MFLRGKGILNKDAYPGQSHLVISETQENDVTTWNNPFYKMAYALMDISENLYLRIGRVPSFWKTRNSDLMDATISQTIRGGGVLSKLFLQQLLRYCVVGNFLARVGNSS
ncbi:hypothetical protein NPIL_385081 [Nephila pilipes]|uniref:Uncharacterized protein n=1 Tax=Nephila pilipes TaxID=299642 RepID=A0A8X6MRP0_NEPPI|nr:hypothetical protein NPIL_385081 [Nephila pilipes]